MHSDKIDSIHKNIKQIELKLAPDSYSAKEFHYWGRKVKSKWSDAQKIDFRNPGWVGFQEHPQKDWALARIQINWRWRENDGCLQQSWNLLLSSLGPRYQIEESKNNGGKSIRGN